MSNLLLIFLCLQSEGHEPAGGVWLVRVRERDHLDRRGEDPPGVGAPLGQRDQHPQLPRGPGVPPLPPGQGRGQHGEGRHQQQQHLAAHQNRATEEETLRVSLAKKPEF